jgi:uncharacterized protein YqjF (DUF2071 family)
VSRQNKLFLSAKWTNLIIATYKVNPVLLEPHLPKGLLLDTIDGNAFVSLVAFDFTDTRLKGLRIPFHVNFPEINLRFYVKDGNRRGVVFISEFVPKFFISLIANKVYNESYKCIDMKSNIMRNGKIFLNHVIRPKNSQNQINEYQIKVECDNKPFLPPVDSTEHYFKEHEWGFGKNKKGETLIYRVEHPNWEIYPITKFEHNFDFEAIYEKKWKILDDEAPYNVTFAKGSEIKVFETKILR